MATEGLAQEQSPINVTVKDSVITISIPSNPSTGYKWTYQVKSRKELFSQKEDRFVLAEGDENRPGASGLQIFDFTASQKGKAVITFGYSRPWEKGNYARQYTVEIKVNSKLEPSASILK